MCRRSASSGGGTNGVHFLGSHFRPKKAIVSGGVRRGDARVQVLATADVEAARSAGKTYRTVSQRWIECCRSGRVLNATFRSGVAQHEARGTRVDALGDDVNTPRGRARSFGGVAASRAGRRGDPRRPRRGASTDISRPRFRVAPMGRDAVVQASPGLQPRGSLGVVLRGRAGRARRHHRPPLLRGARVSSLARARPPVGTRTRTRAREETS